MRKKCRSCFFIFREDVDGLSELYTVDETFSLSKTLECGQCFHYIKEDGCYTVFGLNEVAEVWQENNNFRIKANNQAYWRKFFALDIDYNRICEQLKDFAIKNNDDFMIRAIEEGKGIRLLRQPYFETACSFILSQRNNIPRIRKMVFYLSKWHSTNKVEVGSDSYLCFPSVEDLKKVSLEELKQGGLGYRAEYLYDFVRNWEEILKKVQYNYNADFELFKLQRGIGDKVANCICLYGFREYDAFPIDTWMKKIIDKYYNGRVENLKIPRNYAGILQQFMFYYERSLQGFNNGE